MTSILDEEAVRETAWLIERAGPFWWRTLVTARPATIHIIDATNSLEWTADANEAVRFSRKEDADHVAAALDIPRSLMTSTEHVFVSAPSTDIPAPLPGSGDLSEREWAITAAAQAFCNRGIIIACPWEGDLDDEERERFDALVAAIDSYNALVSPPKAGARELTADEKQVFHDALRDSVEVVAAPNHEARRDGVRVTDAVIAQRRHMCALAGPCSDNGDGCSCSDADLASRVVIGAPPLGDGRAEIVEEIAKLAESKAAAQSEFQESAYSRGDDIVGHGHWKAQCELLTLAAAIRSLSTPGGGL